MSDDDQTELLGAILGIVGGAVLLLLLAFLGAP